MKKSKKQWHVLALATAAILNSACTPATVYLRPEVEIPPQPAHISISREEMRCLSQDAYTKLVRRDAAKQAHIERLEAILRALGDATPTE